MMTVIKNGWQLCRDINEKTGVNSSRRFDMRLSFGSVAGFYLVNFRDIDIDCLSDI